MSRTDPTEASKRSRSPSGPGRQDDKRLAADWHRQGVAHLTAGQVALAEEAIRRAAALDPTNAVFHNNLGVVLLAQQNWDQAKSVFAQAISINQHYADAIVNLGLVESKLGHAGVAAQLYEQALTIQPGHADALFNWANLLFDQGRAQEAVPLYKKAADIVGGRGDVLNNLGRALLVTGQIAEATTCFARALATSPEAAFNLGIALARQDQVQEAAQAFEKAVRLRPGKPIWRLHRLGLCPAIFQSVAELDDYRGELDRRLDEALETPLRVDLDELASDGFVPSFNLAHHGRSNRRLLEKFASLFAPHIPKREPAVQRGKQRVGFVVTEPHVGSFLRTQGGIVAHLDTDRFDVAVFSTRAGLAQIRAAVGRPEVQWVPFPPLFTAAVNAIAAVPCNVLYFHKVSADPLGYLLPFARLAPVQCTSWATHFTSGVAEVDFYLSSSLMEIEDADKEYVERLVRFRSSPSYEYGQADVPAACRADFGLPSSGSLYLCPQRLAKFHPAQDELFRQVLEEDTTGTLVLLARNNDHRLLQLLTRFRRTLAGKANRICVVPPQSALRLRQLMSVCDALLDIQHYSVSLMAKDALGVGLPIVTLPGIFKVERYALGFYRRLGISDLIASSASHYVQLAVRLGKDATFRQHLSRRIQCVNHLVVNDKQTVAEFEEFVNQWRC